MNTLVNCSPEATIRPVPAAADSEKESQATCCTNPNTPAGLLCAAGGAKLLGVEVQQAVRSFPASYWFSSLISSGTAPDDYETAVGGFLDGAALSVLP